MTIIVYKQGTMASLLQKTRTETSPSARKPNAIKLKHQNVHRNKKMTGSASDYKTKAMHI
jgi:hypothetical protein